MARENLQSIHHSQKALRVGLMNFRTFRTRKQLTISLLIDPDELLSGRNQSIQLRVAQEAKNMLADFVILAKIDQQQRQVSIRNVGLGSFNRFGLAFS